MPHTIDPSRRNALWQHVIESAPDMACVIAPDMETLAMNDAYIAAMKRVFGVEVSVGMKLNEWIREFPGDYEKSMKRWRAALNGKPTTTIYEYGSIKKEFFEFSTFPLYDDEGVLIGAASMGRTFDRHKRLENKLKTSEKRLEAMNDQLRVSNIALEFFANAASHDLQEPLRIVTCYLELLNRSLGERLHVDEKRYMENALNGAERMKHLIRGLLEYSRINSRGEEFEQVDMGEVVGEALGNLQFAVEEHQGCVNVGLPLPVVMGDPQQLVQLLQNLVINALKYHDNGEAPRIEILSKYTRAGIEIHVNDNGPGIPANTRERIFKLFYRMKDHRNSMGSGMGLAICQRIIERHNGRIWVQDNHARGASFRFMLPQDKANNS